MSNPNYPEGVTERDIDRIGEPMGGQPSLDNMYEDALVQFEIAVKQVIKLGIHINKKNKLVDNDIEDILKYAGVNFNGER